MTRVGLFSIGVAKAPEDARPTKTRGKPFLVRAIGPPKVTRPTKTKVGPFSISDKSAIGSFVTKSKTLSTNLEMDSKLLQELISNH
jgi:tripartite-type tricarboxylate transporter receptor subunit TctC